MNIQFRLLFLIISFCTLSYFTHAQNYPFKFIENQEQWEDDILFKTEIPNGYLFFHNNQLTYTFYDGDAINERHEHGHESNASNHRISGKFYDAPPTPLKVSSTQPEPIKAHGVQVSFLGSNSNPKIRGKLKQDYHHNYFLGNNTSKWSSNVSVFAGLQYESLYPQIDLKFLQINGSLKYEFVVKAEGNPEKIQLSYEGAESVYLLDGNLHIETSINSIIEQKPYIYQIIKGDTVEIPSRFKLSNNVLSFELLESYDTEYELIIDPTLIFSSYSGSLADNWANTATFDAKENSYVAGLAFGVNFPITTGAFAVTFSGQEDMVIMKYNPTGTGLLYATFVGGGESEVPISMITNSQNDLVIMGVTGSNDFPTTSNAIDTIFGGGDWMIPFPGINEDGGLTATSPNFLAGTDLFISILNEEGNQLNSSTYIGGSENDGVTGGRVDTNTNTYAFSPLNRNYGDMFRGEIILDDNDNIVIATVTESADFPVSTNAFDQSFSGLRDAIAMKLSADASTIEWATFVGGTGIEGAYGITLDENNNVYLAGGTSSTDFPTTLGTLNTNFQSGSTDGFVSILSANGSSLIASTYLGTNSYDQAYLLDLDSEGNVAVFGQTQGNYVVTQNTFGNPNGFQFVHKLTNDLQTTVFSARIGSGRNSTDIVPTAFTITNCNTIYLAGWGGVTNNGVNLLRGTTNGLPTTNDALQTTTDGSDFYIMILSENAESLLYGTYLGAPGGRGDHVDGGTSRFDPDGIIYQAVCSCQTDNFPTTEGAFSQLNNSSNCNMLIFKIDLRLLASNFEPSAKDGCAPLTVNFDNQSVGGVVFEWDTGDGNTITDSENLGYTYETPGEYVVSLKVSDPTTCQGVDIHLDTIRVFSSDFSITADTTICSGESLQLNATGGTAYNWISGNVDTPNIPNPLITSAASDTYTVEIINGSGCIDTLEVNVDVFPEVIADFGFEFSNQCESPGLVNFTNQSVETENFIWQIDDLATFENQDSLTFNFEEDGDYIIRLEIPNNPLNPCIQSLIIVDTIRVRYPNLSISQDTSICLGDIITLNSNGLDNFLWEPAIGIDNPTVANPTVSPTQTTTYTVTTFDDNCSFTQEVTVEVIEEISLDFDLEFITNCGATPIILISNNSTGGATYNWFMGDGQQLQEATSFQYQYTDEGEYTITLEGTNGNCQEIITETITVEQFVPPNTFTPNNDNRNEFFDLGLQGIGTDLKIYNRWGEELFHSTSYQNDWNGDDFPTGIYLYVLTNTDGKTCRGWVKIMR